jgi:RHS repeat-associated protein
VFDADEFGNPMPGRASQRYGWLGGKYRSSEALAGVVLMGVRLYNPNTGRFLSVDPVEGGSCNSYDYACADPVNGTDLDGRKWCWKICKVGRNPYWRMAFHGGRGAVNLAGWAGGAGEARAAYRAVRLGYKNYRYVKRHGFKAHFRPWRHKGGRKYYAGQAVKGIGYLMGYHDLRDDWRGFRRAGHDASRPIGRNCRGVRRLIRWGHGNNAYTRSYNTVSPDFS